MKRYLYSHLRIPRDRFRCIFLLLHTGGVSVPNELLYNGGDDLRWCIVDGEERKFSVAAVSGRSVHRSLPLSCCMTDRELSHHCGTLPRNNGDGQRFSRLREAGLSQAALDHPGATKSQGDAPLRVASGRGPL